MRRKSAAVAVSLVELLTVLHGQTHPEFNEHPHKEGFGESNYGLQGEVAGWRHDGTLEANVPRFAVSFGPAPSRRSSQGIGRRKAKHEQRAFFVGQALTLPPRRRADR